VASRVVSVCFCAVMVTSVGVTFSASATMTAEVSMQAFVVAIYRASLSHLNDTMRSP
jgi:competence transcription factor ComK